jgi:hypothetical protein
VKVTLPVSEPALAVLVNVPHSVVLATMVSVKGAVEVKVRKRGHVTVFSRVVHEAGTESIVNPDGTLSTMGVVSAQPPRGHRCVMVKVIGCPTAAALGFAVLSIQKLVVQGGSGTDCAWAGLPIPNSITPPTTSMANNAAMTNACGLLLIATSCILVDLLSGGRAGHFHPAR